MPGVAGTIQQGSLLYPKPPPAPGTPGGNPVAPGAGAGAAPSTAAAAAAAAPAPSNLPVYIVGGVAAAASLAVVGFLTGVL